MKRKAMIFLAVSLALAGCGEKEQAAHTDTHAQAHEAGDIAETTKSAAVLPSFLSSHNKDMQNVYQLVGQNYDLLQWIPCYCGCGESAGHNSNENCFIREVKGSGEVVWDSHATKCVNCLEIAVESVSLREQGKSIQDIRSYIDAKYKEGYAKPTPTPQPS